MVLTHKAAGSRPVGGSLIPCSKVIDIVQAKCNPVNTKHRVCLVKDKLEGRLIMVHAEFTVKALYDQLDREMERIKDEEAKIRRQRAFLDTMVELLEARQAEPASRQLTMAIEDSVVRGTEREFTIMLGKTNYEQGFFNVPVTSDGLITEDECRLTLPNGMDIRARITRNQNRNGTARIFGSATLKHWFQDNFDIKDSVSAYIRDNTTIMLGNHTAGRSQPDRYHTVPITRLAEFLPAQ